MNNYNSSIEFTVETEVNNSIPFLDLQIIHTTTTHILINWYKKTTASRRYINFYSHHPLSEKIAIVYSLVDKSIKLAHSSFHINNLNIVKNLLLNNDYPSQFIEKYMH